MEWKKIKASVKPNTKSNSKINPFKKSKSVLTERKSSYPFQKRKFNKAKSKSQK